MGKEKTRAELHEEIGVLKAKVAELEAKNEEISQVNQDYESWSVTHTKRFDELNEQNVCLHRELHSVADMNIFEFIRWRRNNH